MNLQTLRVCSDLFYHQLERKVEVCYKDKVVDPKVKELLMFTKSQADHDSKFVLLDDAPYHRWQWFIKMIDRHFVSKTLQDYGEVVEDKVSEEKINENEYKIGYDLLKDIYQFRNRIGRCRMSETVKHIYYKEQDKCVYFTD
jgi:hypothetical protein